MKTVGIICEYNPFHLGHRIQLDAVREQLGEDTCVIALMSGSFVERGGPAVLSKSDRASIALDEGVDLVLELPFPWCMSGADRFAAGAMEILEGLGCVDYLAFGSESAELASLQEIASVIASDAFDRAVGDAARQDPTLSYAALRECAYQKLTGGELPKLKPNDLLGVAYLAHLRTIEPLALRRLPGYSATKARKALSEGDSEALREQVPPATLDALCQAERPRQALVDATILNHLLLTPADELANFAECNRELAGRMKTAAMTARSLQDVIDRVTSKHYTSARVRRAIWHSYLRTPSDMPAKVPHFTNLLGADAKGREFLRMASKQSRIEVVTRPSNAAANPIVCAEFSFSDERDRIYDRFCEKISEKKPPLLK